MYHNVNAMKTDAVEIFQTIRAALQPYATLGFSNRINSDEEYDLWSDKNVKIEGLERNETFFACLKIEGDGVHFKYTDADELVSSKEIKELDDVLMKQIENELSIAYKYFKEQEWV